MQYSVAFSAPTIDDVLVARTALVTGVGRRRGIGAAISRDLLADDWDICFTWWSAYDDRMDWGRDPETVAELIELGERQGRRVVGVEADLGDPATPPRVFAEAGPVQALICSHCECVPTSTDDTTVEGFDLHYAVNVRATWLLIREFGRQLAQGPDGSVGGWIVTLTSDHVVGNLPYGATKAAADRVTLAAAHDLAHLGVTANAVNPGPVDTGWMTDEHRAHAAAMTPLRRPGLATDTADLVQFLCSDKGGWISGQLLKSNGAFTSSIP